MARYDYGYVRSWDDPKYLQQLYDQGYGGALFQMDDPRLGELVNRARQLGLSYGIWGATNQGGRGELSPWEYANYMARVAKQYGAQIASLNIEAPYKGYQGSEGWNRNNELASYWQQLAPQGIQTWISPLGSAWAGGAPDRRQDFNFDAWKGIATGWNPQAYGATLDEQSDPTAVVQALINSGIDPSMISPLIAPGQNYGGAALYGLNEFGDLPKAPGPAPRSQATGGSGARTTSTRNGPSAPGPKLSQSRSMIEQQGLRWGGQTFKDQPSFEKYLTSRGKTYDLWAKQHQPAAQALGARSQNARPRS